MACSLCPEGSVASVMTTLAMEAEDRFTEVTRLIADIAEPVAAPFAVVTDLPSDLRAALAAWKESHRLTH